MKVITIILQRSFYFVLQNVSDKEWEKALRHLNNTSELNYLTQIVFMQYEDMTVPVDAEDRFRIEIFFR